jgi:hypothetical protein
MRQGNHSKYLESLMAQVKLSNKEAQATFHLVHEPSSRLTREHLQQLIEKIFLVAGAKTPGQDFFTQFVVLAEDDGTADDSGKLLRETGFGLRGEIHRTSFEPLDKTLKQKYDDEAKHRRYAGHESTVAPEFLTQKTLAIVIGGRKFLARCMELYLERYGLLREELIPMLVDIAGMKSYKAGGDAISHIVCPVYSEKFYAGNFNAHLAEVRKVSTLRKLIETAE